MICNFFKAFKYHCVNLLRQKLCENAKSYLVEFFFHIGDIMQFVSYTENE